MEIINGRWENAGQKCLKPYEPPQKPEPGTFRLTFGRCPVHTQGHTVNNRLLFEQMPENVLWINQQAATKLGIQDGDLVEVSSNGLKDRSRPR